MQLPQIVHVVQDIHEAKGEHSNHVNGERRQKEKEIAVVSSPNAVVHPWTVMVKILRKDSENQSCLIKKYSFGPRRISALLSKNSLVFQIVFPGEKQRIREKDLPD